jgi:hypothetical protein
VDGGTAREVLDALRLRMAVRFCQECSGVRCQICSRVPPLAFDLSEPVWVTWTSGFRASIATRLLQRLGY